MYNVYITQHIRYIDMNNECSSSTKTFFRDVGSWSAFSFVPLLLSSPILISENSKTYYFYALAFASRIWNSATMFSVCDDEVNITVNILISYVTRPLIPDLPLPLKGRPIRPFGQNRNRTIRNYQTSYFQQFNREYSNLQVCYLNCTYFGSALSYSNK